MSSKDQQMSELGALIQRSKQQEQLSEEEIERMLDLAQHHKGRGLINPEDDPWTGLKEEWHIRAQESALSRQAGHYNNWF